MVSEKICLAMAGMKVCIDTNTLHKIFAWLLLPAFILVSSPVAVAGMKNSLLDYFSGSYREARDKFLLSAAAAGARIESFQHPHAGPDGMPLFIDVAVIGRDDADRILVLASGTHGVEGFAGSAVQTGLLWEGIAGRILPGLKLVMIHAINPYGFACLRRVNEDNVDINRNFVDHASPYPENPGYERLADVIAPESLSLLNNARAYLELFLYRLAEGKKSLQAVLAQGQYLHPDGLFYGGNAVTWSAGTVQDIARRYLSGASRVVFIDIHTGLGSYGTAEVIINVPYGSDSYLQARRCWGQRLKNTAGRESVSVDVRGPLREEIPDLLSDAEVTAATLELGTYSTTEVFRALRAENWQYHNGSDDVFGQDQSRARLLEVFYPPDDEWRRSVWNEASAVVEESLGCLQE